MTGSTIKYFEGEGIFDKVESLRLAAKVRILQDYFLLDFYSVLLKFFFKRLGVRLEQGEMGQRKIVVTKLSSP